MSHKPEQWTPRSRIPRFLRPTKSPANSRLTINENVPSNKESQIPNNPQNRPKTRPFQQPPPHSSSRILHLLNRPVRQRTIDYQSIRSVYLDDLRKRLVILDGIDVIGIIVLAAPALGILRAKALDGEGFVVAVVVGVVVALVVRAVCVSTV